MLDLELHGLTSLQYNKWLRCEVSFECIYIYIYTLTFRALALRQREFFFPLFSPTDFFSVPRIYFSERPSLETLDFMAQPKPKSPTEIYNYRQNRTNKWKWHELRPLTRIAKVKTLQTLGDGICTDHLMILVIINDIKVFVAFVRVPSKENGKYFPVFKEKKRKVRIKTFAFAKR